MRLTLRHVLAAVTFTLAACSGNEPTPAAPGPSTDPKLTLSLSAHVDTIPESTTKAFTARVTDQTGFLKSVPVTWASTDPNVASVTGGQVTGVTPGAAWVVASVTGARDSVRIIVIQNELTLDVQPSAAAVALGDTVNFIATLRTRSGDILSVNNFTWVSSDTSAAQFFNGGSLKAKREGELLVSATAMNRRGEGTVKIFTTPVASVSITPSTANVYRGETIELKALPLGQNGRLTGAEVTWGSSDNTKATVDQNGVVSGIGTGTVVITATAETKTASATITVLSPPAASVKLTVPSTELLVGTEMQATATLIDDEGEPVSDRTVAWQSNNPSIATVSNTGTVKGVAEGDVNVSVIADGIVASQKVSVKGRTPARIQIQPDAPNVTVGQTSQLVAKVLDQNGVEVSNQSVTWTSSNTAVAKISSTGMLSGLSSGSTTITANSGQLSAAATATVVSAPVASVRVSPTTASLTVGGPGTTLKAEALDASSNVLSGRAVSWQSQSPSIADVNSSGVVSPVAAGTTTITATIEGKSASASITVAGPAPGPVSSVAVTLSATTLDIGGTSQATAVLKDAKGNVVSGPVEWSSLDNTVAAVSGTGLITAKGAGTVAILATSNGISGAASVNVNTPTLANVARIEVEAPNQNIKVGDQVQTTVTLYDAEGKVVTGRTIEYTTQNSSILSVTATGVVKGVGGGTTKVYAKSGGVTGAETFYVTASTTSPTAIAVSPSAVTLNVGETKQATASAQDASGASLTSSYSWTTSNPNVATVSGSGLVSATGAGSATITASASGATGSMSVTVNAPTSTGIVKTVAVSLSLSNILVGGTAQATAIARDVNGVVISGKTASWSLGVSQLATINQSGLVTALAAGTVPVIATIDGIQGSASLVISAALPPPPPASYNVELPRTYLNFPYPARTGKTITVSAGGDFQAALNNAQRGDEIVLQSGATFTGNFFLPAKSGNASNGWIVIRSSRSGELPPIGTRVGPQHASLMAKIVTPNTTAAINTAPSTSGWRLVGLEVTITTAVTIQNYGLMFLGDAGQTTLSAVPSDLVLDRMYVHGQTSTNTSRCIALNSARTEISDSYLSECHGKGFDSQAILGWNGPGPFKIVNNMLMGAGENVMFGGSDPKVPNLVPSDIEIRRNYFYTPLSWKGIWTKKNLFELKNATRVLVEGNVFDGSWTDAQPGWAILLRSANQDGKCRWCRTTDVTIRRNYITHVAGGIAFIGGAGTAVDTVARRLLISETVFDSVGVSPYNGERRGFIFNEGAADITMERTVVAGNLGQLAWIDPLRVIRGLVLRDNVWYRGMYGISTDGTPEGVQSLSKGAPDYSWSNMTLVGSAVNSYPSGTSFLSNESQSSLAAQIRSIVKSATSGVVIP